MSLEQRSDRHLQYGEPMAALQLCSRVLSGLKVDGAEPVKNKGVVVEVITTAPYTNVVGVVTAVGGKFGDVLLTVEPQNQLTRPERVNRLAAIIRRVDGNHDLGAAALAEALLDEGVIPTRDF